jgi:hypothetical protein
VAFVLWISVFVACDGNTAAITDGGSSHPDARDGRAPDTRSTGEAGLEAGPDQRLDAPPVQPDLPQPAAPLLGVYAVTGQDPTWGPYTGQAEVRAASSGGGQEVHHVQLHDTATFEGERVASAWQGTVVSGTEPYLFQVTLDRVGFVKSYQTWARTAADATPATFAGVFQRSGPKALSGTFTEATGSGQSWSETWTWIGPGGPEPIWRNKREAREGHPPLSSSEKATLSASFASYQALPAVQPYASRPEFQQAMHYFVFDPTDYDFYQQPQNKDVLRVIQKVVDPISLVEARRRNRAYRMTLAEKAAAYDAEIPALHLNSAGMLVSHDPTKTGIEQHISEGDSMEWTGDYVFSQALRYLVTGQQEALDHMVQALKGIILCYDIVGTKGEFARTLREHVSDGNPSWVQGLPPYEAFDWLKGGNNDMLKGYELGFLWAHLALEGKPAFDSLRQRMGEITEELLAYNPDVTGLLSTNASYLNLLLYVLTGDLSSYGKYLATFTYLQLWLVNMGNGSTYKYGVSDWSGNFMNVKTLAGYYTMELYLQKKGLLVLHVADFRQALTNALVNMRSTRVGFYQLAAATLGQFTTPPPELEDAVWTLRELPFPKVRYSIDWRINPSFCMSPFPSLPWKLDWDKGSDRTHSLTAYPVFERSPDIMEWKADPGGYEWGASVRSSPGVDLLLAYWFGRYHGVISPTQ